MRPTRIRYFGRSGISRPSLLQIFHKIKYFYISGSHMCLRYEKIICYDWIIQRLLELFVCTDFIFIVILTSSTIYFCSIFRYLVAIINIYTHTCKYLSMNIYKYLYFWRNSQIFLCLFVVFAEDNWMFVWVSHTKHTALSSIHLHLPCPDILLGIRTRRIENCLHFNQERIQPEASSLSRNVYLGTLVDI